MSSILTNAGAMTALQSLQNINKNLATTQNRISTGLRVSEASHNAAYWSIATTMRSDNGANSVVQDALGLGAAKVDVAYTAMEQAISVVNDIKEKVLLAKTASEDDRGKIDAEIKALQAGLTDMINGASYAGSNLLKTDSSDDSGLPDGETIITSYNRTGTTATTGTLSISYDSVRLVDDAGDDKSGALDTEFSVGEDDEVNILNLTVLGHEDEDDGDAASAAFDEMLSGIEAALSAMTTGAAELGAAKQRIDLQQSFISALSDAIDRGVGQLVDADMEEESTRLQALQTQQQLGIQALAIANANSQNILALFR